jgi:LysM repeat protein
MVGSALKASRPTPSGLKMAIPKQPAPMTLAKLPRTAEASGNRPEGTPGRLSQIHIVRPGENLEGIARSYGTSARVLIRANSLSRKSLKPGKELFIPPSIQVVFDNRRINFDVLPRVENGKPITPFRQIFEHTGGVLYWYPSAKAVRAINDTREIEIRIGQTRTLVNNEPIEMDLAAFIDSGRTMVPLTFVSDSLDVQARYNPSTGKITLKSQE